MEKEKNKSPKEITFKDVDFIPDFTEEKNKSSIYETHCHVCMNFIDECECFEKNHSPQEAVNGAGRQAIQPEDTFNLSEKIDCIPVYYVKEFIKRLQEDYFNSAIIQKAFNKRIDKLAGKELI